MKDNLENRSEFDSRTGLDNRTGLDSRRTGNGTTIAAVIAAVVIAGALFLYGPWSNDKSTVSNSSASTTTGQSPGIPRATTPASPIAPLPPNAPATTGTVR